MAWLALEVAGAEGSSDIPMKEIDADEILEKVQKGQAVEYDHVIVRGNLDLSRERLHKNVTSPIRINDCIFDGLVSFNGTTFEKPVDLSGSNFTRDVYFRGTEFNGVADFGGTEFNGDADFSSAEFSYADFGMAEFNGVADFRSAGFSEGAHFGTAEFNGGTYFGGTEFSEGAHFGMAEFNGDAYFGGTEFNGVADFGIAEFSGDAYFRGTEFNGVADFRGTEFNGDADFRGTEFNGDADFRGTEFNGNIEFGDARFENETSFYRILFKRPAYFENCSIENLNLTKAEYNRLHLRWNDIDSLHFDEAAYLALIKNYNTLGWYGDANRCYYDYRNVVRRSWQAPSSGFAARLSSLFDRLVDFGEWLLYGYGVRPSFPLAWSVSIILAFGLFFRQKRCLRKIITEERIEDSKDASDEVLINTIARRAEINSFDPFLFSLFTFTSGFTAFLHPAVQYKLERCLRWAIAERLLGPFFLALVITTISKTYLIR